MSFNKAESVAATSGYWRWVGDVEEMRKQRKSYRPKFRMNGTEAAIASLDPDWLLAQARAMNDAPRPESDDGATPRSAAPPPGYALCADIFARQQACKADARDAKLARRELRAAERSAAFKKGVMRNLRRATHDAPFMPTKNRNSRPFASPRGYDGGPAGVETYNDAKRGFYHSMDTNHHDVVHQLLDHETKHVDAVDHLTVNHAPLPEDRATVPSSA
jgi:hypothetical protein